MSGACRRTSLGVFLGYLRVECQGYLRRRLMPLRWCRRLKRVRCLFTTRLMSLSSRLRCHHRLPSLWSRTVTATLLCRMSQPSQSWHYFSSPITINLSMATHRLLPSSRQPAASRTPLSKLLHVPHFTPCFPYPRTIPPTLSPPY